MSSERRGPDLSEQQVNGLLRSYLREEWHEDANRVASSVLDELDSTPQRRSRWTAWRSSVMNNNIVRVGLAAAAVVVIAIIAINLLPGSTPPGGAPSASPSVEPSEAGPSTEPAPSAEAFLPPGPILLWDPSLEEPGSEAARITVTISSEGWQFREDYQYLQKSDADEESRLLGPIVWPGSVPPGTGFYVFGDPCQSSSTRPDTPATTVDEIVAALAAQADRDASEAVDVTIDGYAGQTITLHVPDDADLAACDGDGFATYEVGDGGQPPGPQDPGQIDQYWFVDVEGSIVFIDAWYYPDTPDETVEEMQAIVESATFDFP
jgi:hypothetical protein